MKGALAVVGIVAIVLIAGWVLCDDDPDPTDDDSGQASDPTASFAHSVSYDADGSTITLSPMCGGLHRWTVEADGHSDVELTSGRETISVLVPATSGTVTILHEVVDGTGLLSMTVEVELDPTVTVTLTWTGGSVDVVLDAIEYKGLRTRSSMGGLAELAEREDAAAERIAAYLLDYCDGMTGDETAAVLLRFVQETISYETDMQSAGCEEWYKTVYETVYDGEGDCEDTAIMFASIGRLMGLDVVLVRFDGHLGAAVAMDECEGVGWELGGVTYYYCETATDTVAYAIGEHPLGLEMTALIAIAAVVDTASDDA